MSGAWWHAPVAVRFGAGAVADVGVAAAPYGRRAVLVTDERLAGGAAVRAALGALAAAGVATSLLPLTPREPDLAGATRLAAALGARRVDVVVAVGGGSVLDAAKLAVAALRTPAVARVLAAPPPVTVVEVDAPPARPAPRLVAVPTTHGTGAEVSGVASVRAGDRKHLVVGPALWADVAVVDPALGRTVPRAALRAGAVETWSRAFAAFAAPPLPGTTPPLADELALAAGRTAATVAARLGTGELDPHVDAAAAAVSTALGWTSLGRDRTGARLWQAQNEVGGLLGAAKGAALAPLLPAYAAVAADAPTLGDAGRIAAFVAATVPGDAPAPAMRLAAWLTDLGVDGTPPWTPAQAPVLAARIAQAWAAAGADPEAAARDASRLLAAA